MDIKEISLKESLIAFILPMYTSKVIFEEMKRFQGGFTRLSLEREDVSTTRESTNLTLELRKMVKVAHFQATALDAHVIVVVSPECSCYILKYYFE